MFIFSINVSALECEFAVNPEFVSILQEKNGLSIVSKGDKTAVIDRYGNYVIEFDDRLKHIRSNGLIMIVGENDFAAFFNSKGNQLTEYIYDTYPVVDEKWKDKNYRFIYSLNDGDGKSDLVPFSRNKKYGYINSYGNEIVPPVYGYTNGFYNGIASISDEGILSEYGTYTNCKYGLIKDNGEVVVPSNSYWVAGMSYDYEYSYASNGASDEIIADRYGNIDKTDELRYGKINVKYINVRDKDGRTGIVDKEKNYIIPLDFYQYGISRLNGDYFIIDGKKIVNNKNETIYLAPEGINIVGHFLSTIEKSQFARIIKEADDSIPGHTLQGLVNTDGKVIIEPLYESCYDMDEGLIYARDLNKNYLFDYSGNLLCELNGNNVGRSVGGVFSILDFDTMKYGYMVNPLKHPKVYINGNKLKSDVYPVIENDRTLVPMRAIFESFGAEIMWDDSTKTVVAKKDGIEIKIQIGGNVLYKNGEEILVDVPAKIENDRTLVPLRVISESIGCKVNWDGENRVVNINM